MAHSLPVVGAATACIGISFGNSNSYIGLSRNSAATSALPIESSIDIIANEAGDRSTASVVAFAAGQKLIGDAAASQIGINPSNTINQLKTLIGRKYTDPAIQQLLTSKAKPAFNITAATDSNALSSNITVDVSGKSTVYSSTEINSILLSKLRSIADIYSGLDCSQCVLAVPIQWSTEQRTEYKKSAESAGLKVLRMINEPTAVAIGYGVDLAVPVNKSLSNNRYVLVFDCGGSSTTATVLHTSNGLIRTVSSVANNELGGDSFDNRLVDHFAGEFKRKNNGADLLSNSRAVWRLTNSVEKCKRVLSSSNNAAIEVDGLFDGLDLYSTITRAKFESYCSPLFRQLIDLVKSVLEQSKLLPEDISEILLSGGSSRIPRLQELLKSLFNGREPNKSIINPEEIIAYGTTLQAALLIDSDNDSENKSKAPTHSITLSIGIDSAPTAAGSDRIIQRIIPAQTVLPYSISITVIAENAKKPSIFNIYEGIESNNNSTQLTRSTARLLGSIVVPAAAMKITIRIDNTGELIIEGQAGANTILFNIKPDSAKSTNLTQAQQLIQSAYKARLAAAEATESKESDTAVGSITAAVTTVKITESKPTTAPTPAPVAAAAAPAPAVELEMEDLD